MNPRTILLAIIELIGMILIVVGSLQYNKNCQTAATLSSIGYILFGFGSGGLSHKLNINKYCCCCKRTNLEPVPDVPPNEPVDTVNIEHFSIPSVRLHAEMV
jgi:ascorbate-specific PTS system EIIC-type component UlaA